MVPLMSSIARRMRVSIKRVICNLTIEYLFCYDVFFGAMVVLETFTAIMMDIELLNNLESYFAEIVGDIVDAAHITVVFYFCIDQSICLPIFLLDL